MEYLSRQLRERRIKEYLEGKEDGATFKEIYREVKGAHGKVRKAINRLLDRDELDKEKIVVKEGSIGRKGMKVWNYLLAEKE